MCNELSLELFELNLDHHGMGEAIAVTCIATGEIIARFDFCQDEPGVRLKARQFANAITLIYSSAASLNIHGLAVSDQYFARDYCSPKIY